MISKFSRGFPVATERSRPGASIGAVRFDIQSDYPIQKSLQSTLPSPPPSQTLTTHIPDRGRWARDFFTSAGATYTSFFMVLPMTWSKYARSDSNSSKDTVESYDEGGRPGVAPRDSKDHMLPTLPDPSHGSCWECVLA